MEGPLIGYYTPMVWMASRLSMDVDDPTRKLVNLVRPPQWAFQLPRPFFGKYHYHRTAIL
jgi:hypothetical protein